MEERDESLYAFKNIRVIRAKLLIVFLSKWDNLILDDDNLKLELLILQYLNLL